MTDKVKNTITNLIGIAITCIASFFFFFDPTIKIAEYCLLLTVGLALFLFKASQTKNFLMRFLSKKAGIKNDEKDSK